MIAITLLVFYTKNIPHDWGATVSGSALYPEHCSLCTRQDPSEKADHFHYWDLLPHPPEFIGYGLSQPENLVNPFGRTVEEVWGMSKNGMGLMTDRPDTGIDNISEIIIDPAPFDAIPPKSERAARAWEIRHFRLLDNLYIFNHFEENPITSFGHMEVSITARLPEIRDHRAYIAEHGDNFFTKPFELKRTVLPLDSGECDKEGDDCAYCKLIAEGKESYKARKDLLELLYANNPMPSRITGKKPTPETLNYQFECLLDVTRWEGVSHVSSDPKLRRFDDFPTIFFREEEPLTLFQQGVEIFRSYLIKNVFFITKNTFFMHWNFQTWCEFILISPFLGVLLGFKAFYQKLRKNPKNILKVPEADLIKNEFIGYLTSTTTHAIIIDYDTPPPPQEPKSIPPAFFIIYFTLGFCYLYYIYKHPDIRWDLYPEYCSLCHTQCIYHQIDPENFSKSKIDHFHIWDILDGDIPPKFKGYGKDTPKLMKNPYGKSLEDVWHDPQNIAKPIYKTPKPSEDD